MTIPAAAGNRQYRDPTRIVGPAQPPGHDVGVGAILDLPAMSVVVRGLDAGTPSGRTPLTSPALGQCARSSAPRCGPCGMPRGIPQGKDDG